jgi:hypothetical protein
MIVRSTTRLQSETKYIDAGPQSRQIGENFLRPMPGPHIGSNSPWCSVSGDAASSMACVPVGRRLRKVGDVAACCRACSRQSWSGVKPMGCVRCAARGRFGFEQGRGAIAAAPAFGRVAQAAPVYCMVASAGRGPKAVAPSAWGNHEDNQRAMVAGEPPNHRHSAAFTPRPSEWTSTACRPERDQ